VLAVRNPEPSVGNPYAYQGSSYLKGGPELIANPGGDVQVIPGQLMVVMGSKEQLARFRTLLGAAVVEESPMTA
jgi:voltage-gated potassium channel